MAKFFLLFFPQSLQELSYEARGIAENGRCFAVVLMPPKHLLGVCKIFNNYFLRGEIHLIIN